MNVLLLVLVSFSLIASAILHEERHLGECDAIIYTASFYKDEITVTLTLPTNCPDAVKYIPIADVDDDGGISGFISEDKGSITLPPQLTCNKFHVYVQSYDQFNTVIGTSNSIVFNKVEKTGKVENLMCYTNAYGEVMCSWARPTKCVGYSDILRHKVMFYNGTEVNEAINVINTQYSFSTSSCTESWFIVGPVNDDGTVTNWAESKVCA